MNDKNLTDILDQIEEEHEFVERAASATLWSAAQGISYGRAMQSSEAKVPALVKALRRAVKAIELRIDISGYKLEVDALADIAQILSEQTRRAADSVPDASKRESASE